jgi:hypothetical protein
MYMPSKNWLVLLYSSTLQFLPDGNVGVEGIKKIKPPHCGGFIFEL